KQMIRLRKIGLGITTIGFTVTMLAASIYITPAKKASASPLPEITDGSQVSPEFISSSRLNLTINGNVYPLTDINPFDTIYQYVYDSDACSGEEARIIWDDAAANFEADGVIGTTNTLRY